MPLLFPFKNYTVNQLLDFLSEKGLMEFCDHARNRRGEEELFFFDSFQSSISTFENSLPDFENELLQTIETTNQKTIDSYFAELKGNVDYIKHVVNEKSIEHLVLEWNLLQMGKFTTEVEKETEEYFKSEERKNPHLASIEVSSYNFYLNKPVKTKKINYNFYCIEKKPILINLEDIPYFFTSIVKLTTDLLAITHRYITRYDNKEIKANLENITFNTPVVFVEGEIDITYITKAADLLNETDILNKIIIRQRGGYKNLDKIWNFYKENNWETVPQKKILLYDCDIEKQDEDYNYLYKRIIPVIPQHKVSRGIENLFPDETINKAASYKEAFIDITTTSGTLRGKKYSKTSICINPDEKKNFCDWVCEHATKEDFKHFATIFEIIKKAINSSN